MVVLFLYPNGLTQKLVREWDAAIAHKMGKGGKYRPGKLKMFADNGPIKMTPPSVCVCSENKYKI